MEIFQPPMASTDALEKAAQPVKEETDPIRQTSRDYDKAIQPPVASTK